VVIKSDILFTSGELVEVITSTCHTPDGLRTTWAEQDGIKLSEWVNLSAYPSFRDFEGKDVICQPDQIATVVKSVGRPHSITWHSNNWRYDVYEILVAGQLAQIFANNLGKVNQNQRQTTVM